MFARPFFLYNCGKGPVWPKWRLQTGLRPCTCISNGLLLIGLCMHAMHAQRVCITIHGVLRGPMEVALSECGLHVVHSGVHSSGCSYLFGRHCLRADPGILWKKATRAMRAMRGNTLETVPFQPYFGCTESFLKALSN